MKTRISLLLTLLASIGFASCDKLGGNNGKDPDSSLSIKLNVVSTAVVPSPIAPVTTVTYTTSANIDEAVTVTAESESGKVLVKVSPESFSTGKILIAGTPDMQMVETVKVTAVSSQGHKGEATLEVLKAYCEFKEKDIIVDKEAQDIEIPIMRNYDVKYDVSLDVNVFAEIVSVDKDKVIVHVSENPASAKRTVNLRLKDDKGWYDNSAKILQTGSGDIDEGLTLKELTIRDSLAIRELYMKMHMDELAFGWYLGHQYNSHSWLTDPETTPLSEYPGLEFLDGRVVSLRFMEIGPYGEIPDCIGKLTALRELTMPLHDITGKLPVTLVNCKKLYEIDLANSQIEGTLIEEPWLSLHPHLKYINISGANMTGSFPAWVVNMYNPSNDPLEPSYYFTENKLSGKIPEIVSRSEHWNYKRYWAIDGTRHVDENGQVVYDYEYLSFGEVNMRQKEGYVLYE